MKKKNTDLAKRSVRNIISFFIEFLVSSTIFTNCLHQGHIAQFLGQHLSLSLNTLMFISLTVLLLSASLRPLYAKYLNQQMDKNKLNDNKTGLVTNKQKAKVDSHRDEKIVAVHQLREMDDHLWQDEEARVPFTLEMLDDQPKRYRKVYKR